MSSKNLQLCRFCQKHVKLAYYCEECGTSCCSDCLHDERVDYFICQECNSKNIEFIDSNGKKLCKDCGTENINNVTQHLKSCPKCHSHKILNIYEKKEELEQKFLELIKDTRSFIHPLRDGINELYILRHKINVARSPPIKCYHYPKMESELLVLFKQIIHIKDTLLEKINTHFRHLALNKEFFFDIYNQPNSNIRIIENILENVCRSHESIKKFIEDNNREIYEKLDSYQKNLNFIEKIKKLFLPYKRFLNLAENEKPVYAIKTILINGMDSQNKFIKKNKGLLFITNYDLSFVHEYGMIKKKQELIFKAPINDLINITDKGKLFKKLFIQFDYGKYEFSLPSNLISKVIDYILLARSFQENDIYNDEASKNLQEIDIDLSDLLRYIEEGINSFFSLKIIYNKKINKKQKKELEFSNDNQLKSQNYDNLQNKPRHTFYQEQNPHYIYNPKSPYPSTQYQNPDNYYYRPIGSSVSYDIEKRMFYPQNNYNGHRYQNYNPHENLVHNPQQSYHGSYPYENGLNFEEKNILMKALEKINKHDQQVPAYTHQEKNAVFNQMAAPVNSNPNYNNINNNPYNNYVFNDYQKSHLSEFFDPYDPSLQNPNQISRDFNDNFSEDQKKMIELEKERYSLKKTLKQLETKFENGIISDVDYFRTYKKLQKDIYSIEKKIEKMKEKVNEELFLRRNFNKKKYTF